MHYLVHHRRASTGNTNQCRADADIRNDVVETIRIDRFHPQQRSCGSVEIHNAAVGSAHQRNQRRQQFVERTEPVLALRSEEHTSELQSLMRISYAVFCLKKKKKKQPKHISITTL